MFKKLFLFLALCFGSAFAETIEELTAQAEKGDIVSQFELGMDYYKQGKIEKAIDWWQKSAEQGNKEAQFHLSLMYEMGEGVEESIEKALYWYEKSAEQNHITALHQLISIYTHNETFKNPEKALFWTQKLKKAGDDYFNQAMKHFNGIGVKKDVVQAEKDFKQACALEILRACEFMKSELFQNEFKRAK